MNPMPGPPSSGSAGWWGRLAGWKKVGIGLGGLVVVTRLFGPAAEEPAGLIAAPDTSTIVVESAPSTVGLVPTTPSTSSDSTSATLSVDSTTTASSAAPTNSSIQPTITSQTTIATTGDAATVVFVVDGDTLDVLVGGVEERLRLIGINSPESGECFAAESGDRLAEIVSGGSVTLVRDQSERDQYRRLLRYVYVGGEFVNETLVREGLAIARRYEPDTAMASILESAQEEAIAAGSGLWAPAACGAPAESEIQIGQIRYDADGDDNTNLNDEWVEFLNPGDESVDLSGWMVKDESASHRYAFPTTFHLAAGASVRLHTGCGEDTQEALFWCNTGSAVWNNTGDTVFLIDPSGNIASSKSYSD